MTNPMTTFTPEALGKLLAEATPGPWKQAAVSHNDKMALVGSNFDDTVEATKNGGMWVAQCIGPDRDGNSALIALAPTLSTALLSSQARERELVEALREVAKEAKSANDVIALNRDGGGQGRIRVATAMHRIHRKAVALLTRIEADRKGEQ